MVIFSLIFKYAFWRICHIRSFWPPRNQCFKNAYSVEWDNDMIVVCVSRLHYFPRTSKGLLDNNKNMYELWWRKWITFFWIDFFRTSEVGLENRGYTPKTHTNKKARFLLNSTQSSLALIKLTRKAAKKPFDLCLSLGQQFSSMLLLAVLMSFESWLLCW